LIEIASHRQRPVAALDEDLPRQGKAGVKAAD
jgi:hypothetical protein